MENLGLWDLLTLTLIDVEHKYSPHYFTESKFSVEEDKITLILENFAQAISSITGWFYSKPKSEKFKIIFVDIKNSTESLLLNDASFIEKVFKFLAKTFQEFGKLEPKFKLVGDGILFLSYYSEFSEKMLKISEIMLKKSWENLRNNTDIDFRIVGGVEKLHCIEFKTRNGNLKECIGFPISCLVKLSKQVEDYKWFGELTPKNCKQILLGRFKNVFT